jgi:hypothetical protein
MRSLLGHSWGHGLNHRNGLFGLAVCCPRSTRLLALFLLIPPSLFCQTLRATVAASSPAVVTGEVLAEILDPALGQRWELTTDLRHPAGPWRLILAESRNPIPSANDPVARDPVASRATNLTRLNLIGSPLPLLPSQRAELASHTTAIAGGLAGLSSIPELIVIHAGDRIVVEQKTAVLTAQFGAVAMEQAVTGQQFRVRLNTQQSSPGWTGGTVIQVVAVAKGQARWSSLAPIQPVQTGERDPQTEARQSPRKAKPASAAAGTQRGDTQP